MQCGPSHLSESPECSAEDEEIVLPTFAGIGEREIGFA
jgi:hypothetical protein